MKTTDKKERRSYNIFNVFSWIMGGLSLLNLIEDLSPIKILGKLKVWLDAYVAVANRIGNYLFDWMEWRWMNISELENHVLIIAAILSAAYSRAEFKLEKMKGTTSFESLFMSFTVGFIYFLIALIPALLLPSNFGLFGSILGVAFNCFVYFFPSNVDRGYANSDVILKELLGVFAIFFLLMILNYTVFS